MKDAGVLRHGQHGRESDKSHLLSLSELGVSGKLSSRCQSLADKSKAELGDWLDGMYDEQTYRLPTLCAAVSNAVHVSQNTGQPEWFTPAGILDAAAAKYSQSKVLKETAKVAQNKGKAPTLGPNGPKVSGKATPTFGPVGPKVNNRATAVAAEKGLRADTEAVNAIQLGRLHIQARLGELMPPGKRGPGKKVSSGTLTKLSKPTLACFRKVEKNADKIDAYHKSNGKRRGTCWATLIGGSNGTLATGSTPARLSATSSGASTKRRASSLGSHTGRRRMRQ